MLEYCGLSSVAVPLALPVAGYAESFLRRLWCMPAFLLCIFCLCLRSRLLVEMLLLFSMLLLPMPFVCIVVFFSELCGPSTL